VSALARAAAAATFAALVTLAGLSGCGESDTSSVEGSARVKAMVNDFKNKKSKAWRKVGKRYVFDTQRPADEQEVAPK
jgi:hypothetical protein